MSSSCTDCFEQTYASTMKTQCISENAYKNGVWHRDIKLCFHLTAFNIKGTGIWITIILQIYDLQKRNEWCFLQCKVSTLTEFSLRLGDPFGIVCTLRMYLRSSSIGDCFTQKRKLLYPFPVPLYARYKFRDNWIGYFVKGSSSNVAIRCSLFDL